jgi:hypothetical protein
MSFGCTLGVAVADGRFPFSEARNGTNAATARQQGALMLPIPHRGFHLSSVALAAGFIGLATALAAGSAEAPFLTENQAAMDKMMAGMNVKPSGDVDHDFTAMMIPHHQGAIDMAQAELRHGRNEQLRRIAQGIIVEQQQEIAAMRLALGQSLPASVAAPNQPSDLSAATPQRNLQKEPR